MSNNCEMSLRHHLKELGYRIAASTIGIGMVVVVIFAGDILNLEFLQSKGGIVLTTIILGEALFFTVLIGGVLYKEFKG